MDDIRPLKDLVEISGGFLFWPLILLILLLVAAVVIYVYSSRKKKLTEAAILPPRPPEEIAIEALRALLEMRLAESGMIKEYYVRLSDIIRTYIEGRFRIFALDMTTREVYQEMRLKKINRLHTDKMRGLLEDCDLVKFAKYLPVKKEIEEAYKKAEEIVEATKSYAIC